MSRNETRLKKLEEIAKLEGILIRYLDRIIEKDWNGLYLRLPVSGAAIAIRSDLTLPHKVWVLAHELGHHFIGVERFLFSPFQFPITFRKSDQEEVEANEKALEFLSSPEDWREVELIHPTNLFRITNELELPIDAGIAWEKKRRKIIKDHNLSSVEFSDSLWLEIKSRTKGSGGAQKTFQVLTDRKIQNHTNISFSEFSLFRERAVTFRGGWAGTYRKILSELETQILERGGVNLFFSLNET